MYWKLWRSAENKNFADHNTRGPYNLDETKLPVVENSETIRVNGTALELDKDYTVDLEAGRVTFINNNLNLTPIDEIVVEYRYLTEDDIKNYGQTSVSDSAWLMSLDSNYGKFKHTLSYKSYGKEFMLPGGGQNSTLNDYSQQIEYAPTDSFQLKIGRTGSSSLQDRESGLKTDTLGRSLGFNWKRKAFLFSLDSSNGRVRDNQEIGATDRRTAKQNWNMEYSLSKKIKFGLKSSADNTDETRFGSLLTNRGKGLSYALNLKPFKTVKIDLAQDQGRDTKVKDGDNAASSDKSRTMKFKYTPGTSFMFSLDYDGAAFHNTSSPDSGNRKTRAWIMYQPSDKWSLFTQKQSELPRPAGRGIKYERQIWNFNRHSSPPFRAGYSALSFINSSGSPTSGKNPVWTSINSAGNPSKA